MALFGLFGNSETLYFPGCYSSAFIKEKVENYKRILKKLGVDFDIQKDEVCCGGFLSEQGYDKQLRKTAKENNIQFKDKKIKKILVNCGLCYSTIKSYKEIVPDWNLETKHVISEILDALKATNERVKSFSSNPEIVYYDSCYLARGESFFEQPRELLKLLGYKVIELPQNKEETPCCGSCGGLMHTNKELAENIAFKFIKMLKRKKIKRIVTSDPRAYFHLKESFEKLGIKDNEIELLELSDVICDSLGVKRE